MKVLVLDGNENQTVAAVRSLARAGHEPVVGAETGWSVAGLSRDAAGRLRYPAPGKDAAGFVRAVLAHAAGALVMPMTERSTLPLSEAREAVVAAGGQLVLPDHATLLAAFDKSRTQALAASLGIATPATRVVSSVPEDVSFPVVVKPVASEVLDAAGNTMTTGAPRYARTPEELRAAFADVAGRSPEVLLQEFVAGTGAGYFALMRHGELRAEFAHERLRDVKPTGSGSALRRSARVDPRVRDAALKLLGALGWHGVAMVEFRVRPDGAPVFLEVNGRFWHSLALAIHAGVDFPALLAALARDGDVGVNPGYRVGVRCRWLLGDTRHLAAVLLGPPAGYPGPFPRRLDTLREFVRPVRGTRHDNFTLRDPLPELGDWLDFGLRRVPKAFKDSR